ncbi:MAG: hypothetical protein VYA69_11725 [Gemmatimonadota bacterium]|nr:hypothetical protein [Gemmatimonadota bacterium]
MADGRDRNRERGEERGKARVEEEHVGKDKPEGDARRDRPFCRGRRRSLVRRDKILGYGHRALSFRITTRVGGERLIWFDRY